MGGSFGVVIRVLYNRYVDLLRKWVLVGLISGACLLVGVVCVHYYFLEWDLSCMFKGKVFNIYINLAEGLGFSMGYFLVMNLGL